MSVWDNIKLPKTIFQTSSPYGGKIEVWQVGQTTKLVSDGTVQSVNWDSPSAERMVFGQVASVIKEHAPSAQRVFVLGLAGGAMQHLISKSLPGVEIVSVEIDKVMVEIAKNYFHLDDIPNHKVIVEDACRVIVEPEKHGLTTMYFDVAVVDIYCGDKFPDLGRSGNFFASLKSMVKPGGLVIFNRIYLEDHQYEVDLFIDDLGEFFHDVDTLTIAGKTNSDNILIFGRS